MRWDPLQYTHDTGERSSPFADPVARSDARDPHPQRHDDAVAEPGVDVAFRRVFAMGHRR